MSKSVVITGASTGIGRACALHLDRLGWTVFAGVRKETDADSLRAEGGAGMTPVMLDVTDAASIDAAAKTVLGATGGTLDGLVNNAGIVIPGAVEFVPIEEFRRQLEVNVIGPVATSQAFLGAIREARGRIVHIGSISGRMAAPLMAPYAASKHAIEAIADSMRMELRGFGVHVALVEPGDIETPIWDKSTAFADSMIHTIPDEALDRYSALIDALRAHAAAAPKRAIPASAVAKAVGHALTSPRPRARYLVGADAKALAWLVRLVPDQLRDRIILRALLAGKGRV